MNSVHQFPLIAQPDPVVAGLQTSRALKRSHCAQIIAQVLFSQHCREEGIKLVRLNQAERKESAPYLAAGELAVQMTLQPDLERTAMMAAAVELYEQEFPVGTDSLFERHAQTQAEYFRRATNVVMAYVQTLSLQSTDPAFDDACCRLFDALEQKGRV